MKKYKSKNHKTSIFTWLIIETILIFAVATISIALYDIYINIEVSDVDSYVAEKISKETIKNEDEDISEILENVSKSIVGISKITNNDEGIFSINSETTLSLGSGIIVSQDGLILTNEHVSGAKYSKCYVSIYGGGKEYQGTVVWADNDIDLSLIKIEKLGLTEATLGNSESIKARKHRICYRKPNRS